MCLLRILDLAATTIVSTGPSSGCKNSPRQDTIILLHIWSLSGEKRSLQKGPMKDQKNFSYPCASLRLKICCHLRYITKSCPSAELPSDPWSWRTPGTAPGHKLWPMKFCWLSPCSLSSPNGSLFSPLPRFRSLIFLSPSGSLVLGLETSKDLDGFFISYFVSNSFSYLLSM